MRGKTPARPPRWYFLSDAEIRRAIEKAQPPLMSDDDLQLIGAYIMPSLPPCPSDLGFLFGTRHGIADFCLAAQRLWRQGMFGRLLISGGITGVVAGTEADAIAERLLALGVPESVLILERAAMNTGENVRFGRARVAEAMDIAAIRSVLVIGKLCSARRYLMTLQRHWPGLRMSLCSVNYFGVPDERWHEDAAFRARVLSEFEKIPAYLAAGFLEEIDDCPPYPQFPKPSSLA